MHSATKAAIALGSNLGLRQDFIYRALEKIESRVGRIELQSTFYETKALTRPDYQGPELPDYLNMVIQVLTDLSPVQLLEQLQKIESELGRDRSRENMRWESRTIDLDIVLFGDQIVDLPDLVIPHPEMHKREFVLRPLAEISPEAVHPRLKKTVREIYRELSLE